MKNQFSALQPKNHTAKHVYAISRAEAFTTQQAAAVLPQHFSFREENEQLLLVVELPDNSIDQQAGQVQQEFDRLFFLTGEQLDPKFLRTENPNGPMHCRKTLTVDALLIKPLASDVDRQQWQTPIAVQLRLWQLAHLPELPIAAQINLLFQIIEISYPDTNDQNQYPQYQNSNTPPHPRTEAKLLRDLASHGKKQMEKTQIKLYCNHLRIQEVSHDPTDSSFVQILRSRVSVVKDEARKIINSYITRKT